jgi:pimeloyl-ACP methyl ester carboxylesterase
MNAPNELKLLAAPAKTPAANFLEQGSSYWLDTMQRSVLFLDILRERANNMLEHEQAGLPPLLDFEYETILDARKFEHPVNYALLRITGSGKDRIEDCLDEHKPPVVILDPRAGHGPGIGGFKRDSEVGMAMHEGHAVYFVIFFPEPCPGQTLADVLHALRRFVEEVGRRHPGKPPVLYGNCQAGWAVMLLAADCEGLVGPVVLNGSPLSYWAGASDANPMRLAGGLTGGAWLAHFLADLGNGRFDGAWLAQNFENLNPANTLWDKNYKVFANVDTERERFLEFERWWTGFYFLSREEITAIVENLFIGNKLETGEMRVCEGCVVDLKRIRNPIVIFASYGDNITPPHQALNWVPAVYPTTEALKAAGQRIVYLINPHVGHLGIFVSAGVARLEHRAILESLEELETLKPGLYEMKISNPTGDPDCRKPQHSVAFEERKVEDIRFDYPREQFEKVRKVSEFNEHLYSTFVSPWVRAFANPIGAEWLKWMHPMRASRYLFSESLNPWMAGVAALAPWVREHRASVSEDNPMLVQERALSQQISTGLDAYRKRRDEATEAVFKWLYGQS